MAKTTEEFSIYNDFMLRGKFLSLFLIFILFLFIIVNQRQNLINHEVKKEKMKDIERNDGKTYSSIDTSGNFKRPSADYA